MVDCTCKVFKKSMESLKAAETLAWVHGWQYEGKTMAYCPWCGKKLKELKDGNKKAKG